jgi:hypothetical protein
MSRHSLFALIVLVALNSTQTQAAELRALQEITQTGGAKAFYDPEKISAAYQDHVYTPVKKGLHGGIHYVIGSTAWYVLGIGPYAMVIGEDPATFLTNLKLLSQFAVFHGVTGNIYVKATSVTYITAPANGGSNHFDSRIKASLWPGPATQIGAKKPWHVFETPEQAKEMIDNIRQQQEPTRP